MEYRSCGECTACCTGRLIGNAYGNSFNPSRKCVFLVQEKCSIYSTRPDLCRKYQCSWSEHLFDESMRPDKCGVIVTTKSINGKQFLEVVNLWDDVPYSTYKKIEEISKELKIPWTKVNQRGEVGFCGNIKNEQLQS
jgi:Fe-S-cluster containining protein